MRGAALALIHTHVQGGLSGKDNGFQIVTKQRTYMQFTETAEELAEWVAVLKMVQGKPESEIKAMMDSARVNPRNAEVLHQPCPPLCVGLHLCCDVGHARA